MDKIMRTLICDGQVSLAVLETTELVNAAMEIHKTSPSASRILGGLLTCGAYLASSLKSSRGSVSLTVRAKDGDGAVSVSSDALLHVRGYADGACGRTLKGGSLTVVRDDGYSRPFVGACEIDSDDISDTLQKYFGQSEQIASAVELKSGFGEDGKCLFAVGIIMQLMPDASGEAIRTATDLFDRFKNCDVISGKNKPFGDAQSILEDFFGPYVSGEVTALFPEYRCNCSEEKIRGVLASVGKEELLKIAGELGEVRVHCHYCNKDYVYGKERIEEIF